MGKLGATEDFIFASGWLQKIWPEQKIWYPDDGWKSAGSFASGILGMKMVLASMRCFGSLSPHIIKSRILNRKQTLHATALAWGTQGLGAQRPSSVALLFFKSSASRKTSSSWSGWSVSLLKGVLIYGVLRQEGALVLSESTLTGELFLNELFRCVVPWWWAPAFGRLDKDGCPWAALGHPDNSRSCLDLDS